MDDMDLSVIVAEGKGSIKLEGLSLTLRSEQRREVDYWYAYRRVGGRVKKVYLGAELTVSKVRRAAMLLSEAPATATLPVINSVMGNAVTQQMMLRLTSWQCCGMRWHGSNLSVTS
ncbi:MAG: hypothetical protein HC926_03090 [Synechococcaceae cyanobacterium SM2_3_60]|nr:hypothetical protein [Synechococcaceae cyanobacterium SM2_3_60]